MFQELFIILLSRSWDNSGDLKREEAGDVAGFSTRRPHGPAFKLDVAEKTETREAYRNGFTK